MRRRAVLLLNTMVAALVLASGVALAANIDCEAGTKCLGTDRADTMTGTNRDDDMSGLGGGDTMRGRDGKDMLSGDEGDDEIYAGPGNDPLVEGGAGDDSLTGGDGDDFYVFGPRWGADTITSGEDSGKDTLDFSSLLRSLDVDLNSSAIRDEAFSRAGMLNFPAAVKIENVKGGKARDVVRGNDASNDLRGNGGNDTLVGDANGDALFGGLGADALNGGAGTDVLNGSDVSDVSNVTDVSDDDVYLFQNGWGKDSITDAAGTDRLYFGELTSSVTVDLATGKAYETASGSFESSSNSVTWTPGVIENVIENAIGGTAADFLYGDSTGNMLNGHGENDTMYGRDGDDTMYGHAGDDTMYGGPGSVDKVYGDHPDFPTAAGNDTIEVWDGDPGDFVNCGPGDDTVKVDAKLDSTTPDPDDTIWLDTIENCEPENVEEKLIPLPTN